MGSIPGTSENAYNGAKRFYLSIYNGKLAQSVKETDEGALSRINKNDKKIWEKYYESITGELKDVVLHSGNFGDEVHIKLAPNADSEVIIQMPFDSKYATEFLMKLPNIDLNEPVTARPYNFNDKDKTDKDGEPRKVIGIALSQSGTKINKFYTTEQPNGYPFPEIGADGKFVFLDSDDFKILNIKQKKFLKLSIDAFRNGEMKKGTNQPVQKAENPATKQVEKKAKAKEVKKTEDWSDQITPEIKDDLPF